MHWLRLPEPRWFVLLVARHLPVWLAFAGMNIFAVVALGVDVDGSLVIELIFVTCVSWMAGFVVVGVPGGIGVRETIFISMTTATLGAGVAVSAAVLSRVVSIAVDLLAPFTPHLAAHDQLLAVLYGGAVTGIGMGLVFKARGNTGGTDVIAQLLVEKVNLGIGQLMLAADAVVTLVAAVVLGPDLMIGGGQFRLSAG